MNKELTPQEQGNRHTNVWPFADVLRAAAVLVLEGRRDHLVPEEAAGLHPCQGRGRRVTPLWHKDDEGQRLAGVFQKILRKTERLWESAGECICNIFWTNDFGMMLRVTHLKVCHHGVHEFLTERRVGLKWAAGGREAEDWPVKTEMSDTI